MSSNFIIYIIVFEYFIFVLAKCIIKYELTKKEKESRIKYQRVKEMFINGCKKSI